MAKRIKRSRPQHPFPVLLGTSIPQPLSSDRPIPPPWFPHVEQTMAHKRSYIITPHERRIIRMLQEGKRILFDLNERCAYLVKMSRGVQELGKISIHLLARMMKANILGWGHREGRFMHVHLASSSMLH